MFGLWRETSGATYVEYLVIVAVVAGAGLGAWSAFGGTLTETSAALGLRVERMAGTTPLAFAFTEGDAEERNSVVLRVEEARDTAPYVDYGSSFRIYAMDAGFRDGKPVELPEDMHSVALDERRLRGRDDSEGAHGFAPVRAAMTIRRVRRDLDELRASESGRKILEAIEKVADGRVSILALTEGPADNAMAYWAGFGSLEPDQLDRVADQILPSAVTVLEDGKVQVVEPGSGLPAGEVRVLYNPDTATLPEAQGPDGAPCLPSHVILGHELIHAYHLMTGKLLHGQYELTEGTANHEEAQTIGVGPYAGDELTENALRREVGLAERTKHEALCN